MTLTNKIIAIGGAVFIAIYVLAEIGEYQTRKASTEFAGLSAPSVSDKSTVVPDAEQQVAQKIQDGEWRYDQEVDDISGQRIKYAIVDDAADEDGANTLLIRNTGKHFEAYIATKHMLNPQYDDVYSAREIGVVAYNEKDATAAGNLSDAAHPLRATFRLHNATDDKAVFITDAKAFVNFIANSHKDTMRLKLQMYNGDIHTFIFRINNLDLTKVQ